VGLWSEHSDGSGDNNFGELGPDGVHIVAQDGTDCGQRTFDRDRKTVGSIGQTR
jgi:hypothetical protein